MIDVYNEAIKFDGLREIPGKQHEGKILEMFRTVGHDWVQDDETAWCAAFVGYVLDLAGYPHTGKLNARSYMTWGTEVDLEEAERGDVVVLWREDPTSWKGHVAFLDYTTPNHVHLFGGNQRNMVCSLPYPRNRVLSVRRMTKAKAPGSSLIATILALLARLFGGRKNA